MDVEQESQKTYHDRSTFESQYDEGDLVIVFKPTMKTGQTKKFKSFYSQPQVIREIINGLNFVIEDKKTKKQQNVNYDQLKRFNSRSATIDKKEPNKAKSEPRISQIDLTEDSDFVEIEVVTPKLNDTGRREVNPQENNIQINNSTEDHNETVKEELFETPMGGSTRESININTQNKSISTKIPAPKVAKQQKRDSLVATCERIEGEEFPNRSTASTSQSVTKRRYQTRSTPGITRPRKLKDYFLFKDNDSDEKIYNDVFFLKGDTTKRRGLGTHIGTCSWTGKFSNCLL